MNDENKNENGKFKPGTIVTIPAVKDCPDFIVLEEVKGNGGAFYARCLAKKTAGLAQFAETRGTMYSDKECTLRDEIDRWVATLVNNGLNREKIGSATVYPSAWMSCGHNCEEKMEADAYPLTLDEYCYFRKKTPAIMEADGEWWLRTQDYGDYRYCVDEYGNIGSYPPEAIKGVRPTMFVEEDVLVEARNEVKK